MDRFPGLRDRKLAVVLGVTVFGYVGGLVFCTNAGMYWLQLFDKYAANWSVLVIAIMECVLISWCYGTDNFLCDIQEMIGVRGYLFRKFWTLMWKYLSPATLLFILVFNWIEYTPAKLGSYVYPFWANAIGWIVALLPIIVIATIALYKLSTVSKGSFMERVKLTMKPTDDWGPSAKNRAGIPQYARDDSNLDDDGGLQMNIGPRNIPNGNSFDNPSFKTTAGGYTFETTI